MTPKSLFNIILKVLGLFMAKDVLVYLPQIILTSSEYNTHPLFETFLSLFIPLPFIGFNCWVVYMLIFKTDFIIELLKLENGFDQEELNINLHRSTFLSIVIIVIGGVILVEETPNISKAIFIYLQEKRITDSSNNPTFAHWIPPISKVVIALLLIGEQKRIVNFIESKRKK